MPSQKLRWLGAFLATFTPGAVGLAQSIPSVATPPAPANPAAERVDLAPAPAPVPAPIPAPVAAPVAPKPPALAPASPARPVAPVTPAAPTYQAVSPPVSKQAPAPVPVVSPPAPPVRTDLPVIKPAAPPAPRAESQRVDLPPAPAGVPATNPVQQLPPLRIVPAYPTSQQPSASVPQTLPNLQPAQPAPVTPAPAAVPASPAQPQAAAAPQQSQDCQSCQQQQQQPSEEELRKAALHDNHRGPDQVAWLRLGYLFTWVKHGPLPASLVTTGPGSGAVGTEGTLGQADTRVLLGGAEQDFGTFNGAKLEAGMWVNACHTIGFEFGGFILENRSQGGTVVSDPTGSPLLARPISEVLAPQPPLGTPLLTANTSTRILVAAPGSLSGGTAFTADSRLSGAEFNLLRNLASCENYRVDLIGGFRYLDLDEDLDVNSRIDTIPGGTGALFLANQPVTGVLLQDRFRARNQFYGGQVGLKGELLLGRFSFGARGSVAMGPNHEVVDVAGATTDSAGGMFQPSGLLAVQGGNVGRFVDNSFVIVPEFGVQAGLELFPGLRVLAGYNFLYINNVMRPGDELNLNVNPRLVPISRAFGALSGPAEPTFPFHKTDFYAHGVQLSIELAY